MKMILANKKPIIILIRFCALLFFVSSCGLVSTIKEFPENATDELEVSMGVIGENAGSGLIRGLSSTESLNNTEILLDALVKNVNESLKDLELDNIQTEAILNNLVIEIANALDDNSVELSSAVNNIIDQIRLEQIFLKLASEENKHAISSLVGHIFSEESGNGEALGEMLNEAIANIDVSPLTDQLNQIKLDEMLTETANSISEASSSITAVSERIRIGQEKFYLDVLIISLAALIVGAILWFLRNYFEGRRYFINRKKEDIRKRMKSLDRKNQEELLRELQGRLKFSN